MDLKFILLPLCILGLLPWSTFGGEIHLKGIALPHRGLSVGYSPGLKESGLFFSWHAGVEFPLLRPEYAVRLGTGEDTVSGSVNAGDFIFEVRIGKGQWLQEELRLQYGGGFAIAYLDGTEDPNIEDDWDKAETLEYSRGAFPKVFPFVQFHYFPWNTKERQGFGCGIGASMPIIVNPSDNLFPGYNRIGYRLESTILF